MKQSVNKYYTNKAKFVYSSGMQQNVFRTKRSKQPS